MGGPGNGSKAFILFMLDMGGRRTGDGGAGGVRTRDLLDAIEARSQLRYGPTKKDNNDLLL
jgi:hypothetical protein